MSGSSSGYALALQACCLQTRVVFAISRPRPPPLRENLNPSERMHCCVRLSQPEVRAAFRGAALRAGRKSKNMAVQFIIRAGQTSDLSLCFGRPSWLEPGLCGRAVDAADVARLRTALFVWHSQVAFEVEWRLSCFAPAWRRNVLSAHDVLYWPWRRATIKLRAIEADKQG